MLLDNFSDHAQRGARIGGKGAVLFEGDGGCGHDKFRPSVGYARRAPFGS